VRVAEKGFIDTDLVLNAGCFHRTLRRVIPDSKKMRSLQRVISPRQIAPKSTTTRLLINKSKAIKALCAAPETAATMVDISAKLLS
jgi:sarcosine oxidase gamma subunit